MAAGLAPLGAEGGPEGIDLAEGHGPGLGIELARLGQVGLLPIEEIHLKEVGSALHRVGGEDRGIHAHEAAFPKKVVDGPLEFVAYP